jgi:hypothetical protein
MRLALSLFKWLVLISILYDFSLLCSCKKTVTVKDIHTDTTYLIDTTILRDTVYDLTDSLVAYYNFNNGSLKDSSIWHNDIIFNSATVTTDRFGNPGNAYLFGGSTSYMRVPDAGSLHIGIANATIMAIVKFNDFNRERGYGNDILMKGYYEVTEGIYSLRAYPQDSLPVLDTASEAFVGLYGDGLLTRVTDPSVFIHAGQWYIVVMTYDKSELKLYVNGNLVATNTTLGPYLPNSDDLYIGRSLAVGLGDNPPNYFHGVIDEIRIYDKALHPEEILQFNKLTR